MQEIRVRLTEEQDHRRREKDLRPYEQMSDSQEKPLTEKVEESAEVVR